MWFWWFMFVCNLLVPAAMIIGGRFLWKHCPKDINGMIGYRTERSMRSMDAWKFAHDYIGRLWWKAGWIMLVLSIPVQLPFWGTSDNAIGFAGLAICTAQVIVMLATIVPTENALKKFLGE